jgi:hypothetical protein
VADTETSHRPPVEIGDQLGDRLSSIRQAEETAVPRPRQNAALYQQQATSTLALSRRSRACVGGMGGVVVRCQIEIRCG